MKEVSKIDGDQFGFNVAESDVHNVVLKCDKIHVSCHCINVDRC